MDDASQRSLQIKTAVNGHVKKLREQNIIYLQHKHIPEMFHILQNQYEIIGFFRVNNTVITEFSLFSYGGLVLRSNNVLHVNASITRPEREVIHNDTCTIFGETYTFPVHEDACVTRRSSRLFGRSQKDEEEEESRYDFIAMKKLNVVVAAYYDAIRSVRERYNMGIKALPWHVMQAIMDRNQNASASVYKIQYTTALEGLCNAPSGIPTLKYAMEEEHK